MRSEVFMNNCPNCGSNVNSGEAFCRMCGTKMPVSQTNFSNNTQQPQNNGYVNNGMLQSSYINNEDLADVYF